MKSEIGVDGILTRYERSIVAFNKIREVIFVPKYNELVSKKTYFDSINSFNTIQWNGAIQKHYARQERKEALEAHDRYMKKEQQ